MMPAKSTSDQRTYSSMMNGPGPGGGCVMPGEARALRGGAKAFQSVGLQAPPQRGAADAEAAGRFGQLPFGVLQRLEDRQALPVCQRLRAGGGEDGRLAEGLGAALQRREAGAEILEPIAHVAVLPVHDASRRGIGVEHAPLGVEYHDPLADRIDDGPGEGREAGGCRGRGGFVDHTLVTPQYKSARHKVSSRIGGPSGSCLHETLDGIKRLLLAASAATRHY